MVYMDEKRASQFSWRMVMSVTSFVTISHIHIMMPSHHTMDAHHMGKHFSLNQSTHWLMPSSARFHPKLTFAYWKESRQFRFLIRFLELWELESILGK
jgi:hypothetical protein